jgi:hypothetical protein
LLAQPQGKCLLLFEYKAAQTAQHWPLLPLAREVGVVVPAADTSMAASVTKLASNGAVQSEKERSVSH